jgi:hypothetical protein
MSINARRYLPPLLLAFVLGRPADVEAQPDDHVAEVRHRNNCRLAAQVLRTGHPAPRYEWARRLITSCPVEGPDFLVERWHAVRGDTAELRDLVFHTGRRRDVRLYDAVRIIAADPARGDAERVGAMLALSRYVDPASAVSFWDLRLPDGPIRGIPLELAWTTGGIQVSGSQPIDHPVAPMILELLEEIARTEETRNRGLWYAAEVLAKRVRVDIGRMEERGSVN